MVVIKVKRFKENKMVINIAIDGTSGSGKSTVAGKLADKLHYYHLNTGQLYRAYALKCLNMDIKEPKKEDVLKLIECTKVEVKFENGKQSTYLDGVNVTSELNDAEISRVASIISPYIELRRCVIEIQRSMTKKHNIIIEGRDIGTVIIPSAKYKFFVTASVEARAERRYKQLIDAGKDVDYNQILNGLKERDEKDSKREVSPLVKSADAILIDTSNLNIEEVVDLMLSKIDKKDFCKALDVDCQK